jgi:Uma2 family endonuclease
MVEQYIPKPYRFSADEFLNVMLRIFKNKAYHELIHGELFDAPIENRARHDAHVLKITNVFREKFSNKVFLSFMPFIIFSHNCVLAPDIAVLKPREEPYTEKALPCLEDILLLVEATDEVDLGHDAERKLPIYAQAGVKEVWLVNLVEEHLEVYREPNADQYGFQEKYARGQSVAPLAFPETPICVTDLIATRFGPAEGD